MLQPSDRPDLKYSGLFTDGSSENRFETQIFYFFSGDGRSPVPGVSSERTINMDNLMMATVRRIKRVKSPSPIVARILALLGSAHKTDRMDGIVRAMFSPELYFHVLENMAREEQEPEVRVYVVEFMARSVEAELMEGLKVLAKLGRDSDQRVAKEAIASLTKLSSIEPKLLLSVH